MSAPAAKQWVNYRLTVTPEEATNEINHPHTFTILLEQDTGSGFVPAADQPVAISISGVGTIQAIPGGTIVSDLLSGGCTTDVAGLCTVTITSSVPGDTTVTGTYNAVVGTTTGTFSDSGVKHWIVKPSIKIVKTANPISGTPGQTVTYTYVVTNTGDTPLYDMVVTDDKLGQIGTIAGPLNPGDSVTLTKTTTLQNIAGLLTNVGTVVGSDHFGHTVTAHDDAVVTIVLAERITLPRTGWDLVPPTGLGLGLFIVGSVLLWIPRRRRPA